MLKKVLSIEYILYIEGDCMEIKFCQGIVYILPKKYITKLNKKKIQKERFD